MQRIPDTDGVCYADKECGHTIRYRDELGVESCACHLPEEAFQHVDLTEAVTYAALEAEDMEVNVEGQVRLKEDNG